MREALFIKKNKERWLKSQREPISDPDEMAKEFIQLVDDLAYAKTFYPASKATEFINKRASSIYLDIYRNRKEESNRLIRFWKVDLPLTIWKHRKPILFSLSIFVVFFIIGFFVARNNEGVLRSILGDAYVDETLENIDKKNPFGIYEGSNPILMWLGIMVNNTIVSFRMFFEGIFLGIPAMLDLARFAVTVGAFDQIFASHGMGLQFFMVVFIHGTLELTAVIIACGAGIVLGKSFLFPGTISRLSAFKQGAKDGIKLMMGIVPVFIVAAVFEGFITRLYNDLSVLTSIITSLSVIFVIWYFIIYPARIRKRFVEQQYEEDL